MNPETKAELVNSLRTTLWYLLNEELTSWLAGYLMIVVMVTGIAPECIRRKRCESTVLDPVRKLYMDQRTAMGACGLMLFGLVRYLTDSLAVYQTAGMAMTAFSIMYSAQGVCLLAWWLHKKRGQRGIWLLTAIGAVLMLPMAGTVLMLLGVIDQFADPRKLRAKDIEGGTEI